MSDFFRNGSDQTCDLPVRSIPRHLSREPVRVSVCHCLECQKRSGSAFAVQARWPDAQIELTGTYKTWRRTADSGRKATYYFAAIVDQHLPL
ncbi:MAG: GFA family protein [Pseudomonadota bacterium]